MVGAFGQFATSPASQLLHALALRICCAVPPAGWLSLRDSYEELQQPGEWALLSCNARGDGHLWKGQVHCIVQIDWSNLIQVCTAVSGKPYPLGPSIHVLGGQAPSMLHDTAA